MNKTALSFNDILLRPADWSRVKSRADVDTSQVICGETYKLPVIASNMTAVYSPELSREVLRLGGAVCVPRFYSIEENIRLFKEGIYSDNSDNPWTIARPWVSVGVTKGELERAEALSDAGAPVIVVDVALGAAEHVLSFYNSLREIVRYNVGVIVGNFATANQIKAFNSKCKLLKPDAFKIGIGQGSACCTRVVTGVGIPTVTTIEECVSTGYPCLLDGGITNAGDLSKALALGCRGALIGRLFAACEESGAPYESYIQQTAGGDFLITNKLRKIYKGSASLASYKEQGKNYSYICAEGAEYTIPVSGTVESLMKDLSGGLRSSMSYLNSFTLEEYRENCEYLVVTENSSKESTPYGASN